MSSKTDEILDNGRKMTRENLEQWIATSQHSLSPNIVSEIRDLIHQNKALIETLLSMKRYREDVSYLMQEYIDPEIVTEFVYRILIYFSELEYQSPDALSIRHELNAIRKSNIGGYYFTVLE